jgi:hydrogenase-4 transcriptional activator
LEQNNMSLDLRIWKEACLQAELPDLLERVLPLLASRLPVDLVCVRRIDRESPRLEVVAALRRSGQSMPGPLRTELEAIDLQLLLEWAALGLPRRVNGASRDPRIGLIIPAGMKEQALAGPLVIDGRPEGVLIFTAEPGAVFSDTHLQTFAAILAPFAAVLEKHRLRHEVDRLRETALAERRASGPSFDMSESIIGSETGLRGVMERVEMVAPTDAPVLILGETGSGKEVVARAIHSRSRRKDGPILRVNCGAIPSELVDSELFGHERGSFTGAVATRKGWFERADGGTLFLDEIGELPFPAQVRLLRILQDGSFERVGGQQLLTADVRIVAATHRDLQAMVGERRFRDDLWYRISVFPIRLPPLRMRREDIPSLASHFAQRAGTRLGASRPLEPSPRDLEVLQSYSWPGNVRELAAVIERAAILGHGKRLEVEAALGSGAFTDAGSFALVGGSGLASGSGTPTGADEPAASLGPVGTDRSARSPEPLETAGPPHHGFPFLDEAMARHIAEALHRVSGRIEGPGGAAALLGINPHTLRARMRKLGIEWGKYRGK